MRQMGFEVRKHERQRAFAIGFRSLTGEGQEGILT